MSNFPSFKQLSELNDEKWVENVRKLFEPSKPLEEYLLSLRKNFKSYEEIIEESRKYINDLFNSEKNQLREEKLLQVINAHPRLGEKDPKKLSEQSKKEQKFGISEEEEIVNQFLDLSQKYENKFGFKFIIFVNGRTKKQLIAPLIKRLQNENREEEMREAIDAMLNIALDRLKKFQSNL